MSAVIEWMYPESPVSKPDIEYVEKYFEVKLPDDLKSVILRHNGASPRPCTFNLGKSAEVFRQLFSFKEEDESFIIIVYKNVREYLPAWTFPIADDPTGNLICIRYANKSDNKPIVVYWEHDSFENDPNKRITKIANSFSELLSCLH